jgi:hypothetical protein
MTNFIQTRSFDQRNGQGGFAIGLILLVVLLIAVIVGAIAIASRSSSNSGTQEKDRVAASSLLTQAQTINNAYTRATQGGFGANIIYISYNRNTALGNRIDTDQANLVGSNGFVAVPQINTQAYRENSCANAPIDIVAAADAATRAGNCMVYLTQVRLANPNGSSSAVWTKPLTDPVARQVNAILWGVSPGAAIPTLQGTLNPNMNGGNAAAGTWGKLVRSGTQPVGSNNVITVVNFDNELAATAIQPAAGTPAQRGYDLATANSTGVVGSNLPVIAGQNRPEGTFFSTAGAAANLTGNVYYRVLDNL